MSSQTLILGAALAPAPSLSRSRRLRIRAQVDSSDKSVEVMRKFSEQYARRSGTYFCVDKGVTSVVIKGLAEHKDSIGAPLCPCIMMTRLPRQGKDFGTVHVYPCGKGRSATVCFFSLPKMILPGRNRPSPWKRSKRRRQNSEVVASHHSLIFPAKYLHKHYVLLHSVEKKSLNTSFIIPCFTSRLYSNSCSNTS